MTKHVYKFTKAGHAIGSLRHKRLKLSTIDELNDPFDLCPLDTTNPTVSEAANAVTSHFRKTVALLCLSRNWDNLLLWSHYGDSHAGVCLGFDIPEGVPGANYDTDVLYQPSVLQIRSHADVNYDLANRLFRTKHESWSYEQEVRMFVALNDPPDENGRNWIEFGPQLQLREVIIGAQCPPSVTKEVREVLKPYADSVKLWWSCMRPDAFVLIKQDRPPEWHAAIPDEPEKTSDFVVGFPEMWKPVYAKYKLFFDCTSKLAPIISEMVKVPVSGPLLQVAGRMTAAAANTVGALMTLVLNGYGHDAMKLARSLFEIEINIAWLQLHPEQIEDFTEYHHIQQKRRYDMFTEEEKARFPKERYDQMMDAYNAALPRFATGRDKTRPRNEWCSVSLYDRTKELGEGRLTLYRIFYGQASSIYHLDFSGLAAYSDESQLADMSPSWEHLGMALSGIGCAYRTVLAYDEIATLGFKEKLEQGPGADYVAACNDTSAD